MISLPKMLMIGSTGRNVGKTEFACRVIAGRDKDQLLVGLKVTTVREDQGGCPRGGEGCGVCSSLEGNYCITEETDYATGKDTSRLLEAGADRVYWLRVLHGSLKEGIAEFLELVDDNAMIVCESNSLRNEVAPGLFIMVTSESDSAPKETAAVVMAHADRTVRLRSDGFDFSIDRISVRAGEWVLRAPATAIILAGGRSTRMGADKRVLEIDGEPMLPKLVRRILPWFDGVIVSTNDDCLADQQGIKIVPDGVPDAGPLTGIVSALTDSENETNFITACDIPDPDMHLIMRMLDRADKNDIIVPRMAEGQLEPLFAVYGKCILPAAESALASGELRIRMIYDQFSVSYMDLAASQTVRNLNTPTDYEDYLSSTFTAEEAER